MHKLADGIGILRARWSGFLAWKVTRALRAPHCPIRLSPVRCEHLTIRPAAARVLRLAMSMCTKTMRSGVRDYVSDTRLLLSDDAIDVIVSYCVPVVDVVAVLQPRNGKASSFWGMFSTFTNLARARRQLEDEIEFGVTEMAFDPRWDACAGLFRRFVFHMRFQLSVTWAQRISQRTLYAPTAEVFNTSHAHPPIFLTLKS